MGKDSLITRLQTALHFDKSNETRETNETDDKEENVNYTPYDLFKVLGAELIKETDGYYLIGFQGSNFIFYFSDTDIYIEKPKIKSCTISEYNKVNWAVNDINSISTKWMCFLRTDNDCKDPIPVSVNMRCYYTRLRQLTKMMILIRKDLIDVFPLERQIIEKLEEVIQSQLPIDDFLGHQEFTRKIEFLKLNRVINNLNDSLPEFPQDTQLSVKALMNIFGDTVFGEILSMQVISDNKLDFINNTDKIHEFNLRNFMKESTEHRSIEDITFIVNCKFQNLIINLKKHNTSTERTLYYNLNVMRSGTNSDLYSLGHSTVSLRSLLEVRLTSKRDDYWEAAYIVNDAIAKQQEGKDDELTDEQKTLLSAIDPTYRQMLYWAKKYFNQGCYLQALYHLHKIRSTICNPKERKEINDDFVYQIHYYIGVIYYQLKMYNRAYYYLDIARKQLTYETSEFYIRCLMQINAEQAEDFIQQMMGKINFDVDENAKEQLYAYYCFLCRSLADCMQKQLKYDEMENLLKQMIDKNIDPNFARERLESLSQTRGKRMK